MHHWEWLSTAFGWHFPTKGNEWQKWTVSLLLWYLICYCHSVRVRATPKTKIDCMLVSCVMFPYSILSGGVVKASHFAESFLWIEAETKLRVSWKCLSSWQCPAWNWSIGTDSLAAGQGLREACMCSESRVTWASPWHIRTDSGRSSISVFWFAKDPLEEGFRLWSKWK